jgi:hypothetical protein
MNDFLMAAVPLLIFCLLGALVHLLVKLFPHNPDDHDEML